MRALCLYGDAPALVDLRNIMDGKSKHAKSGD